MDISANTAFRFELEGLAELNARVLSFEGREAISSLYTFDVTVELSARTAVPARLRGKKACLSFSSPDGVVRRIAGVASQVRRVVAHYEAALRLVVTLVPSLWLLSKSTFSRIFQDQSIPEVVEELLRRKGIACVTRLSANYPKREFTVQYHETDLDFITRLLAEEGIFYFFEDPGPDQGLSERVVLADETTAITDNSFHSAIAYRPLSGLLRASAADGLFELDLQERVCVSKTILRGYEYLRPNVDFKSEASVSAKDEEGEITLESYEYQQELEEDWLDHLAERKLEGHRAMQHVAYGRSFCKFFSVGRRLQVLEHPLIDDAAWWTLIGLEHRFEPADGGLEPADNDHKSALERERYFNECTFVPHEVAPRPDYVERPLQKVIETATVVGPASEEIYTDCHGRIKVQFHWDRDGKRNEKSSCWLRVMQPWTGPAWGQQFIPRIGSEVVVAFSGGDVDRPLVIGGVYNAAQPPPFALPENKTQSGIRTRSTPGGKGANELIFEDKAGAERFTVHAERDWLKVVGNDAQQQVNRDENTAIGRHRYVQVQENESRVIGGNEVVQIAKSTVLYVKGAMVTIVEGNEEAASYVAPEYSNVDKTAEGAGVDAAPVATTATAQTVGLFADCEKHCEQTQAMLIWSTSRLGPELGELGDDIERGAENTQRKLSELSARAEQLAHTAEQVRRWKQDGELVWSQAPVYLGSKQDAAVLREDTSELASQLRGLLEKSRLLEQPATEELKRCARGLYDAQVQQLKAVSQTVDESETQLDELFEVKRLGAPPPELGTSQSARASRWPRSSASSPPHRSTTAVKGTAYGEPSSIVYEDNETLSGTEKGGGGVDLDAQQTTIPKPGAPVAWRSAKEDCHCGQYLQVKHGTAKIDAPAGFETTSGGCSVEMAEGTLKLTGEKIELNAGVIELNGGCIVKVAGGVITLN